MSVLKCFIITTENSERYHYMKELIKPFEKNIDFEFIINENFNLIKLATNHIIKFFPYNNYSNKLYDFTDNCYHEGTTMCMYGHYLAYKKICEYNLDKAIILEDNIKFCSDFEEKIKYTIENITEDWDIIHLFSSKPEKEHLDRIEYKKNIYHGNNEWYTTKGQIVSCRFANAMVNLIPFFDVADGITMLPSLDYYGTNLKSFTCYPYLLDINRNFRSARVNKDKVKKNNLIEFEKISYKKHIYMLIYNKLNNYNKLSVYLHIMCGVFLKINDKYILKYNIFEKKNIDNLNIKYEIPSPNDIIKKTDTIISINNNENRTNGDYIFNIENDKYIIFYLFENIFVTYKPNLINDIYNPIIKNLENSSFSIME